MGIIVYNGDSFTYGDELRGSRNSKGQEFDTHHHHTYAYKLSSRLNKKYVNLAQNGSSNTKIFRRTIDFLETRKEKIDLIVVTWSGWGRFEICEPFHLDTDKKINIPQECNMNQIIPSHGRSRFRWQIGDYTYPERMDILKLYTERVLTMQTQIMHGLMYMKHIQWLCDLMDIRVVQGVIHPSLYRNILCTLKISGYEDYKSSVTESLGKLREECRMGLGHYTDLYSISDKASTVKPMGHADEDAHTVYADIIYQITKDKGWFDVVN